jgi:hypothetical protein
LVLFTERRKEQIAGVISCYDRMLIQGTLPGLCYAQGMTRCLYAGQSRIFEYPRFAQPPRDALRENAERLAAEDGLEIEFIRRTKGFRKGDKMHEVLTQRGDHPGLVWIFSRMQPCSVRVPTWCPFRLQACLNGHHRLARRLTRKGIGRTRLDDAFTRIEHFDRAEALGDDWPGEKLHCRANGRSATAQ